MSDEQIEYNRITPTLMFEMQEDYMSDLSKNLGELAIKYGVSYDMLRKVAAANGWKATRDEFTRRYSQEMADSIQKRIEGGLTREAVEREELKRLIQKFQHEEMFKLMDQAIIAHLGGNVSEESGKHTPPAVDTISKLGPVLIKRAEHELRKMGHAEFTNNRRVAAATDSGDPVIDEREVSGAIERLEPESETAGD